MRLLSFLLVLGLIACSSPTPQNEEPTPKPTPTDLTFSRVVDGLNQPLGIAHANDSTGRLFVLERGGIIRVINAAGNLLERPFLDVSSLVTTTRGEQGLLGLAFHPNYQTNGRFFINYIDKNEDTMIAEYQVSSNQNIANTIATQTILKLDQPAWNHNAGHMAFSPKDGYFYIATGDGGGPGDPNENAENLNRLFGKVLRLDLDSEQPYAIPNDNPYINTANARNEIWAYGLRNPWRFSFDRQTSDLYIADVGQNKFEEMNFQPSSSLGKENYGWDSMEGFECFEPSENCNREGVTLPILAYGRDQGVSVTGGYVYRGSEIPWLQGKYVYGDFATGIIWVAEQSSSGWSSEILADTEFNISSFGEDAAGELYLADYSTGSIYKFSAVVD